MKVICKDRQIRIAPSGPSRHIISSVFADVDQLLRPKTLEQLSLLEMQINGKLHSNEPIDVEYWEQLLQNIAVYKAKAELKNIYRSVTDSRLQAMREQQMDEAEVVKGKLAQLLGTSDYRLGDNIQNSCSDDSAKALPTIIRSSRSMDPESLPKIKAEDKGLDVVEESDFLGKIV